MYGFIYVKFREDTKLWRQKADEVVRGWGQARPDCDSALGRGDGAVKMDCGVGCKIMKMH